MSATLLPTGMTVFVPDESNNPGPTGGGQTLDPSRVFVDDVWVDTLTFGTTVFERSMNFSSALALDALTGRDQINVEWGDSDTGSDGNGTPMSRIGQLDSTQESTNPSIQNPALLEVFSGLNIMEMTDGEGGAPHSYKVAFSQGIRDNDSGVDAVPEIVMFERGRNDTFEVSLIIGGTWNIPVLSDPLRISSGDFADLGMRANTKEIDDAQAMGVAGFDLNDWALADGAIVYGYVFEGSGADMSGIFATGDTLQFAPPIEVVPLPPTVLLLAGALIGSVALRRRR